MACQSFERSHFLRVVAGHLEDCSAAADGFSPLGNQMQFGGPRSVCLYLTDSQIKPRVFHTLQEHTGKDKIRIK